MEKGKLKLCALMENTQELLWWPEIIWIKLSEILKYTSSLK